MANLADARRRRYGLIFLSLAGAMLVWGQTLLRPWLREWGFIFYWLTCFALTGLAILAALLDLRAIRRRSQAERRELLDQTWANLDHKPNDWNQLK